MTARVLAAADDDPKFTPGLIHRVRVVLEDAGYEVGLCGPLTELSLAVGLYRLLHPEQKCKQ